MISRRMNVRCTKILLFFMMFSVFFGSQPQLSYGEPIEDPPLLFDFSKVGVNGADGTPSGWKLDGQTTDYPLVTVYAADGLTIHSAAIGQDSRNFSFVVPEAGIYQVDFQGLLHIGNGIGKLFIDGAQLGDYDFYSETTQLNPDSQTMGKLYLAAGTHSLAIKLVGQNASSTYTYMMPNKMFLTNVSESVVSVQVTADSTELFAGESLQLQLNGVLGDSSTVNLNGAGVTYTSSDDSVLEVDASGKVTALSRGSATIAAAFTLDGMPYERSIQLQVIGKHLFDFSKVGVDGADGMPSGWKLIGTTAQLPSIRVWASDGLTIHSAALNQDARSFAFTVPEAGTYRIKLNGALSSGNGIGQVKVDTQVLGNYDFYSATTQLDPEPQTMGKLNLAAGTHTLTLTLVDKNEASGWYYLAPNKMILEQLAPEFTAVTLTASSPVIAVNDTLQLHPEGKLSDGSSADLSGAAYEFASSDEALLEVDNSGLVTAISPGWATVTAAVTLNGIRQEASIRLLALSEPPDEIELSLTSQQLLPGQKSYANVKGYTANHEPIDLKGLPVQFSVSDPGQAAVSVNGKGVVTAISAGTAQIHASMALLGETFDAEATVTVVNATYTPQAIPVISDRWGVVHAANTPIQLNGSLNETAWGAAAGWDGFKTAYYKNEADPDTEVKLTYDEDNLYVGITGHKLASDGSIPSEGFELLISPDADLSNTYQFLVMLKEDQHRQLSTIYDRYSHPPKAIENAMSQITDGLEQWTAEVSIPWHSLNVEGVSAGDEWAINVIRHRIGAQPLSSWVPIRESEFTDNESPNAYALFATAAEQGRMGRVYFEEAMSRSAGSAAAEPVALWFPEQLELIYAGYSEKTVSFSADGLQITGNHARIGLRTPSGERYEITGVVWTEQNGRYTAAFQHPALNKPGLYQLELIVDDAVNAQTRMAVILFDRDETIDAGERSSNWRPAAVPLIEVNASEPSADVERLLQMIPAKSGTSILGLPENPDLHPVGLFDWDPSFPDQIVSKSGSHVYPNANHPEDKTLQVRNAKGELVEYPYYEDGSGKKYFFSAFVDFKKREYVLKQTALLAELDPLGAARLLNRFADVYEGYVPIYDFMWNFYPISLQSGPPYPHYGGVWSSWFFMDLEALKSLAKAYETVKKTDAFDLLSVELGIDVSEKLKNKMFKPSVDYMRTFTTWNSNMDYMLWSGLIAIGNAIDYPDYVHEAIDRIGSFASKQFMFDGFWNEVTVSYHMQSYAGLRDSLKALQGWGDPAGYVSSRTGRRVESLDMGTEFPFLKQSAVIQNLLAYPDGKLLPINDTWAYDISDAPDTEAGSFLLSAAGVGRTTIGEGTEQSQLYMSYSPKFGHNHWDPLNIMYYAKGQELLPDVGYTHSKYGMWTRSTMSHNTVLVDSKDMEADKLGLNGKGQISAFISSDETVQVMKAGEENGYAMTSEYDREPWQIAFPGSDDGYVLDLFRVAGGSRHEYTLHGDANRDAAFTTSLPMQSYGPYLLPEGTPVIPPVDQYDKGSAGDEYYGYLYIRDVSRGQVEDGQYRVTLSTQDPGENGAERAGMQIIGLTDPGESELFLGRSPSLRMTRTVYNDSNDVADLYTMPTMVLRREGSDLKSTFITAMEPYAAGDSPQIEQVERLVPDRSEEGDAAVKVSYGTTTDIILSSPESGEKPLIIGNIRLDGKMGFIRLENGVVTKMMLMDGTRLVYDDREVTGAGSSFGVIDEVYRKADGQALDAFGTSTAVSADAIGQYMIVEHPDGSSDGYKITDVLAENGGTKLVIEGEPGFVIYPDGASELKFYPSTRWKGNHTFHIANVDSGIHEYVPFVESIELSVEQENIKELVLADGGTAQLTAAAVYSNLAVTDVTYEPGTWQSGDTGVAVVEDGLVTAAGAGQTVITASFGGKSAFVPLTVIEDGEMTIAGLSTPMTVGEQAQIMVLAASGNGVVDVTYSAVYSSGESYVASVSASGLVDALEAGTTVITATYGYFTPAVFSLEVRAKANNALLRDLSVNGSTVADFEPANEAYTVRLASGTQTVPAVTAEADDPRAAVTVQPASSLPGTSTVRVTAEDGITAKTYTVRFEADPSQENPAKPEAGNESPSANSPANVSVKRNQVLHFEKGQTSMALTRKTLSESSSLEVVQGDFSLHLSDKAIGELLRLLDAHADQSEMTIAVSPNWGESEEQAVAQAGKQVNAALSPASSVFDVRIFLGQQTVAALDSPIPISIEFDPKADRELLGVYRIGDNGELEYAGGKVVGYRIEALLTGPGQIIVLAFDKSFRDVEAEHWAYRMLKEMAAHHLVEGVSADEFEPSRPVTRAEFTALLVRALGLEAEQKSGFKDVKSSDWFAKDIAAAFEAGLVNGFDDATFAPDRPITREEMAVLLVRAYVMQQGNPAMGSAPEFSDLEEAGEWARQSLGTALSVGLLSGRGDNRFVPQGTTLRTESAQAVYNLLKLLEV